MLSYHLINLPIDVTVAKEIVEKGAVEEGCLVLLEKKMPRNTEKQFSLQKSVSVRCFSLYPIVAITKV